MRRGEMFPLRRPFHLHQSRCYQWVDATPSVIKSARTVRGEQKDETFPHIPTVGFGCCEPRVLHTSNWRAEGSAPDLRAVAGGRGFHRVIQQDEFQIPFD